MHDLSRCKRPDRNRCGAEHAIHFHVGRTDGLAVRRQALITACFSAGNLQAIDAAAARGSLLEFRRSLQRGDSCLCQGWHHRQRAAMKTSTRDIIIEAEKERDANRETALMLSLTSALECRRLSGRRAHTCRSTRYTFLSSNRRELGNRAPELVAQNRAVSSDTVPAGFRRPRPDGAAPQSRALLGNAGTRIATSRAGRHGPIPDLRASAHC